MLYTAKEPILFVNLEFRFDVLSVFLGDASGLNLLNLAYDLNLAPKSPISVIGSSLSLVAKTNYKLNALT